MSSVSADQVLDEATLASLGEPVEEKPADRLPIPLGNEIRRYEDGLMTLSGPSYNMAKDFSIPADHPARELDPERLMDWVGAQLTPPHENPVYVRDAVLRRWEIEDGEPVYMLFQGDETRYPAKIRSKEVFSQHLDENENLRLGEGLRRKLELQLEYSRFLVPALKYMSEDGLVSEIPSVIAYKEGSGFVALDDEDFLESYGADQPGNPHDIHVDVYENADDEPERIILDLSRFDYDEVQVESVDGGLGVVVDGELVYTNNRFNRAFVEGRELPNGLYEIYPA